MVGIGAVKDLPPLLAFLPGQEGVVEAVGDAEQEAVLPDVPVVEVDGHDLGAVPGPVPFGAEVEDRQPGARQPGEAGVVEEGRVHRLAADVHQAAPGAELARLVEEEVPDVIDLRPFQGEVAVGQGRVPAGSQGDQVGVGLPEGAALQAEGTRQAAAVQKDALPAAAQKGDELLAVPGVGGRPAGADETHFPLQVESEDGVAESGLDSLDEHEGPVVIGLRNDEGEEALVEHGEHVGLPRHLQEVHRHLLEETPRLGLLDALLDVDEVVDFHADDRQAPPVAAGDVDFLETDLVEVGWRVRFDIGVPQVLRRLQGEEAGILQGDGAALRQDTRHVHLVIAVGAVVPAGRQGDHPRYPVTVEQGQAETVDGAEGGAGELLAFPVLQQGPPLEELPPQDAALEGAVRLLAARIILPAAGGEAEGPVDFVEEPQGGPEGTRFLDGHVQEMVEDAVPVEHAEDLEPPLLNAELFEEEDILPDEAGVLLRDVLPFDEVADQEEELVGVDGLGEVVRGPELEGLDGLPDGLHAGDHDDVLAGGGLPDVVEKSQAVFPLEDDVGDDDVVGALPEEAPPLLDTLGEIDPVALAGEGLLVERGVERVFFDDEDAAF